MQLISGVNCMALTTVCLFQEMLNRLKIMWSRLLGFLFFFLILSLGI